MFYNTGGKPLIKNINNTGSINIVELTGSDIHDVNQWVYSDFIFDSNADDSDGNPLCDMAFNPVNNKPSLINISDGGVLDYYQLTGGDVNGPYTKTELLTGNGTIFGSSMNFNSAGKIGIASNLLLTNEPLSADEEPESFSSLSFIQL